MKTIFALPLLALGLAACETYPSQPYGPSGYPGSPAYPQSYPEPYPQPLPPPYSEPAVPGAEARFRAVGTEPFWDLTIGRDLVFTDRGTGVAVSEPAPPAINGFAGEIYQGRRINVNIVHGQCSDGMSDRIYPDTVEVRVDGRAYRGCGGPAAAAYPDGRVDPDAIRGVFNLSNTNWRVVSINGQRVPMSGHYLNFMPDRLSGKLGCNTIGAGYAVAGSTLSAGALMMTRMACPDGNFEAQGTAILAQPMTLAESGDTLTLTNRVGTIELVRAR
ncbi:MAG: META domain-containing protein [Pseudomonadota bacterium]|nr:META domain-containing protein [Pseudomonadota bacterium]